MKIVHMFWSFTVGGAETMVGDIMNEQVKNNNVYLLVINDNINYDLIKQLDKKIKIVLLKRKPSSYNLIFLILLNYYLYKIKPDIVHCHNANLRGLILKRKITSVLTVHSFGNYIKPKNKYNKIIAISDGIKKELEKNSITNVSVVYNGVFTDRIYPKEKFNSVPQIVCVGRLIHEVKGQHILIDAFAKIINSGLIATLTFIGDGPSREFLQLLADSKKISELVAFKGTISRNELYSNLHYYDIAVVPSIIEGFGLTFCEAAIAKLPVVVSNCEGLMEVTNNSENFFTFKSRDSESLTEILKIIISNIKNNNSGLEINTSAAYEYVRKKYDIISTVSNYQRIYESVNSKPF